MVAIDLYGFGEAVTPSHLYLYGLLIGTVGERPLGVDCGQFGFMCLEAQCGSHCLSDDVRENGSDYRWF